MVRFLESSWIYWFPKSYNGLFLIKFLTNNNLADMAGGNKVKGESSVLVSPFQKVWHMLMYAVADGRSVFRV